MKAKDDIDVAYLKDCLSYDPVTGYLTWNTRPNVPARINKREAGQIAGTLSKDGYRRITINYRAYVAHRLAWAIFYGEWPKSTIDHIDRKRDNNQIKNLRLASLKENRRNMSIQINNTSGYRGVCWDRQANKWRAYIGIGGGKNKFLGLFADQKLAAAAYSVKSQELYGEFQGSLQK